MKRGVPDGDEGPVPLSALSLGAVPVPGSIAGREFFQRPTRRVARGLLGAWLIRRWRGKPYGARIVEVEAYLGTKDRAAHTFAGRKTPRVAPMWGEGGLLYVYQIYGLYFCANVVTRTVGVPEAVLIRAASHPDVGPGELRGPGKLCRAFGIDRRHSGLDLALPGEFEIRLPGEPAGKIARGPRIGVDYAGSASAWPLRYHLIGEPAVSGRATSSPSTRSRRRRGVSETRGALPSPGSGRSSRSI